MRIRVLELVIHLSSHLSAFMELPVLVWPGKARVNDGKRNDSFKGGSLVPS